MIISAKATMKPTTSKICSFCMRSLPKYLPRLSMYTDDSGAATMEYADVSCAKINGSRDPKIKKAIKSYYELVDRVGG